MSIVQPEPADFLRAIFDDPESWIELRAIEDRREGAIERTWMRREEVIENLDIIYAGAKAEGKAAFFGVLPRIQGKGTSEDTLPSRVAWCDIDFKDVVEEEVWTRVLAFPIVPNIVVHSGRGLHLYWLLKEPCPPEVLSDCSQRAALALGADHCFDAARILRLPGSKNLKACWTDGVYTPDPNAPECTIQLLETEVRHSILEFLALPAPPETKGPSERTMFERKAEEPSSDMPAEVLKWLDGPEADPYLLDLFCSRGKVSGDCSNSGYDFSFAYKLARLGIGDPDMLDAAVNCRPRTDGRARTEREIHRATDRALSEAIEFDEVGKDDAGGVRTFFEQRFPRTTTASGMGTEEEAAGEEEVVKSAERLAWEDAGEELSRLQKLVTEWEAKLPAATTTLATTNSIRQQRRAVLDRIKLIHKSQPLTPQQVHASTGVVAALEELSAAKLALATILEEDKHLFITRITVEEIAAQKEVVSAARRNVRICDQNVHVAIEAAQAEARTPMLAVEQAALVAVEALEQGLIDAKNVFTTVKEGKGLLSKAREDLTAAKKAMQQAEGLFVPSQDVQSQLKFSTYGEILGNKYNVTTILESEPYFKNYFEFDTFAGRPYYGGKLATDKADFFLAKTLEGIYNIPSVAKEVVRDAARYIAENNSFHPVQRYLNGVTWDGVERAKDLLKLGFGAYEAEGEPGFVAMASVKFLICMVARAFEPGVKMDTMLVLSGDEGVYKSSGLKALVRPPCVTKEQPWFSDTKFKEFGSKEMIEQLQGKWLYECGELSELTPKTIDAIKSALSSSDDNTRLAYGHHPSILPRGSAFVATINDATILTASEGRRFICVRVKMGDLKWLEANRDQIWAEATHLYRMGCTWWWEGAEKQTVARVNNSFKAEDPWESLIRKLAIDKKAKGAAIYAAIAALEPILSAGGNLPEVLQRAQDISLEATAKSKGLIGPRGVLAAAEVLLAQQVCTLVQGLDATDIQGARKELQRELERACAFCVGDALGAEYLDVPMERRSRAISNRTVAIFRGLSFPPARSAEGGKVVKFEIRGVAAFWYLPA